MKKELTKEAKYAKAMKDKGFVKVCIWIDPNDKEWFSSLGALSRRRKT